MFKYKCLNVNRLNLPNHYIITFLGLFGITMGLALQNVISNFMSGVLLSILKPFLPGEYISIGKFSGSVIKIYSFYTILKTVDGKTIIVPNNKILIDSIVNYSREPFRRNEFFIGVSQKSDVEITKKTLYKVVTTDKKVVQSKDIIIELHEISPFSINFVVRFWSKTEELNIVYWELLNKFKIALKKKKIEVFQIQINLLPSNNLNNNINYMSNLKNHF